MQFSISRSVGGTILVGLLTLGFALTVMFSYFSLSREYRQEVLKINSRLDNIQTAFIHSLTDSLWKLDDDQIEIILGSIIKQDDIDFVEIRERDKVLQNLGTNVTEGLMSRLYPLVRVTGGQREHIGDLYVEASSHSIKNRTFYDGIYITVTEFVKLGIYGFCILIFIQFVITRHLESITSYFNDANIYDSQKLLFLDRSVEVWKTRKDDLDFLVDSINVMKEGLHKELLTRKQAQDELKMLNANLEKRVGERTSLLLETNKSAAVGEMAAGIAHELNSPLSVIFAISKRINKLSEKEELNKEEVKVLTDRIHHTLNKIMLITNTLRIISRTGDANSVAEYNTERLIDTAISNLQRIYNSYVTNLNFVTNDLPENIRMDETLFFQILFNIVSYRIRKYHVGESNWLRIEFLKEGEEFVITFFDNLECFAEEEKEVILDPFKIKQGREKGSYLILGTIKPMCEKLKANIIFPDLSNSAFIQIRINTEEIA